MNLPRLTVFADFWRPREATMRAQGVPAALIHDEQIAFYAGAVALAIAVMNGGDIDALYKELDEFIAANPIPQRPAAALN